MNLDISSLKTSEQEVTGYYMECHGPNQRAGEFIYEWVASMIDKLGPDDCQFLMRSREPHLRHCWMVKDHYYYSPNIIEAGRFDWGEAAVKISNNPKLEAVRIVNETTAVDSRNNVYLLFPSSAIVEGPPPMPNYQSRWSLSYGDGDYGSGGKIAQNGEQLPGPTDE